MENVMYPDVALDKSKVKEKIMYPDETMDKIKEIASGCIDCKLCMKECVMLNDYCSSPKHLFKYIEEKDGQINPEVPFSCNMCKQCTRVCPKDLKIGEAFMDMRKAMVSANNGKSPMPGHKAIDMHQALSFSKVFNTSVPDKRKTHKKRVFIPGCSLPSYNPKAVGQILEYLQSVYPGTSAILKCCGKPTKALGQTELFKERYSTLQDEIDKLEADEVITACQNCYNIIKENSPNQTVRSLWQVLPEIGLPEGAKGKGIGSDITIAIHDACPTREESSIHDGVRWIMNELGYEVEELKYSRENTKCCGFGGMVVPANPGLSQRVMNRVTEDVKSDYMVTYCASCKEAMARGGKKSVHILDLIFGEQYNSKSNWPENPGNVLISWMNRYASKKEMQKRKK